jgi:hypothetical protein
MTRLRLSAFVLLGVLTATVIAHAQAAAQPAASPPQQVFTLEEALQYAVDHYPTVKAAVEQVNASSAGVSVARAAYLPRLDSLWQTNRATANNVFGQVLPQAVIPALSGPVLSSSSSQSVWGSAAGALFSWEPADFGLRDATVRGAQAAVARARADEAVTRLDVQSAVGTAFFAVVAAERDVAATQADVERRDVLARAAHTLADNQLRPGAEASRADAERAAAQTRFIQAPTGADAGADHDGARAGRDQRRRVRERGEPAGGRAAGERLDRRREHASVCRGATGGCRRGARPGAGAGAHGSPASLPAVECLRPRRRRES